MTLFRHLSHALPRCLGLCLLLAGQFNLRGAETPGTGDDTPAEPAAAPAAFDAPITSTLELQVELHRRGFSCGSIDGVLGGQTIAALRAFQRASGLEGTGSLDAPTRARLRLTAPPLGDYTFLASELSELHPIPDTWLGKSQLTTLGYASAIELAGERYHTNPKLIAQLNPAVDWKLILPGTKIVVPAVEHVLVSGTAAQLVIGLEERQLEVLDAEDHVIAQFPVSIARMAEKRPIGDLHITVIIPNPDYTFDPALFPESPEATAGAGRLLIPPGPNNPVGVVWIGLDRPGYGIHGTPEPEHIGRTESHGCFRMANWDVLTLSGLVSVGLPVHVEP